MMKDLNSLRDKHSTSDIAERRLVVDENELISHRRMGAVPSGGQEVNTSSKASDDTAFRADDTFVSHRVAASGAMNVNTTYEVENTVARPERLSQRIGHHSTSTYRRRCPICDESVANFTRVSLLLYWMLRLLSWHTRRRLPLSGVVLLVLWDDWKKDIVSASSGFIIDAKTGVIQSAAHGFLYMDGKGPFGTRKMSPTYVLVGVIPSCRRGRTSAVLRYIATVVEETVDCSIDSCQLRIISQLHSDVEDLDGIASIRLPGKSIDPVQFRQLQSLSLTTEFHLEEDVRILSFNQGGEGVLKPRHHISLSVDVVRGIVGKVSKAGDSIQFDASTDDDFIVVTGCRTIKGHSGGPFFNNRGEVIGFLSETRDAGVDECDRIVDRNLVVPVSKFQPYLKDIQAKYATRGTLEPKAKIAILWSGPIVTGSIVVVISAFVAYTFGRSSI